MQFYTDFLGKLMKGAIFLVGNELFHESTLPYLIQSLSPVLRKDETLIYTDI